MREWVNRLLAKIGMDKLAHFFGSAFVTLALGRFVHPAISAVITLGLGLGKELFDGAINKKDLLADLLGVLIGVLVLVL